MPFLEKGRSILSLLRTAVSLILSLYLLTKVSACEHLMKFTTTQPRTSVVRVYTAYISIRLSA